MINRKEKNVLIVKKKLEVLKTFIYHEKKSNIIFLFKLYYLKLKQNTINI